MWCQNFSCMFFRIVTKYALDRRMDRRTDVKMDRQNYDPEDHSSIAALHSKNHIQRKSGCALGLGKLPYIWGSPLIFLQWLHCPLSVSRASCNCFITPYSLALYSAILLLGWHNRLNKKVACGWSDLYLLAPVLHKETCFMQLQVVLLMEHKIRWKSSPCLSCHTGQAQRSVEQVRCTDDRDIEISAQLFLSEWPRHCSMLNLTFYAVVSIPLGPSVRTIPTFPPPGSAYWLDPGSNCIKYTVIWVSECLC